MATKARTVILTLSERCNLACAYCYERNRNLGTMSFAQAKDILSQELSVDGCDEVLLEFHGGEIALSFDRLREICEWLWSSEFPVPYRCYSITNGTLIHGVIADWFATNRARFALGLSLDGTPEIHNRNRSGSYDKIDLPFFLANWPLEPVKMTISNATVPLLSACLKHVHGLGFDIRSNLAYGCPWPAELLPTYAEQLGEMVCWYLENPETLPTTQLTARLSRIGQIAVDGPRPLKWCSCGDRSVCYDPDGRRYPCQVFMPSSMGRDVRDELAAFDFTGFEDFHDSRCVGCVLEPSCATCPAHNFLATGTLGTRASDLCAFRKVELQYAATLVGKMLQYPMRYRYVRELDEVERPHVARGVLETLKFLGKID